MLEKTLNTIRSHTPHKVFAFFQPAYHYTLALSSALFYGFPSRKIRVIGVTGTKGKSTTVEIISALLEQAGYKTALSNTIRYKVGAESTDNLFKMSMPGRFFVQRLIRKAVNAKCDFIILEMTSQGTLQYRHKWIELDTFIFTNLSPEHIESHGSYENYVQAKVNIACEMVHSTKKNRTIIVNGDDKEAEKFLACIADEKIKYNLQDLAPYEIKKEGIDFTFAAHTIHSPLSGQFNLYNILAAITCAKNLGISDEKIITAIEKFSVVKGRVERIEAGQKFTVIVDYAHTPDSLEKLYTIFKDKTDGHKNICVLGGTGGGRDSWKRKEMGALAEKYCDEIILTNEDPYDEDPNQIIQNVAEGITIKKPLIIMDRREAMAQAFKKAIASGNTGDVVLITGKGTDPYIMGARGTKIPWSDARSATEELKKLL